MIQGQISILWTQIELSCERRLRLQKENNPLYLRLACYPIWSLCWGIGHCKDGFTWLIRHIFRASSVPCSCFELRHIQTKECKRKRPPFQCLQPDMPHCCRLHPLRHCFSQLQPGCLEAAANAARWPRSPPSDSNLLITFKAGNFEAKGLKIMCMYIYILYSKRTPKQSKMHFPWSWYKEPQRHIQDNSPAFSYFIVQFWLSISCELE